MDLSAWLQQMMRQQQPAQPMNLFGSEAPQPVAQQPAGKRMSADDWRQMINPSNPGPDQQVLQRPDMIDSNGNVLKQPAALTPAADSMTPFHGAFRQNLPDLLGAKSMGQGAGAMSAMAGK